MKRCLSIFFAMIIAITNVVFIAMPSVSAAEEDALVSDDFEGYTAIAEDAEVTLASMQELCDTTPWWYSANYKVFNKADDVKEGTSLIASVVNDGAGNNAMRITYNATAGVGTNIINPAKTDLFDFGKDSYEVSFKFKTTKDLQILGVGGKKVDGEATYYKHNILTKNGTQTYMGDTDYSSPAGVYGEDIASGTWYTLKTVINNGLGYYSVEIFDENGTSLHRVGGINFIDGCPGIANIRFHAPTSGSVVYIDDYEAKIVEPDALLYEDDFNIYSGLSGTTTAGANVFKEISQFRVQNTDSAFFIGKSETNRYLGLNANASAMYMPWNGHIFTEESQATRGKLQLSFKFNINGVASNPGTTPSFRVICDENLNESDVAGLANDNYTMFYAKAAKVNNNIGYGIQIADDSDNNESYKIINKGAWYNVQLTFDLANDKVTMFNSQSSTTYERSTGLYNGGVAIDSIKNIVFKASEGLQIYIDDVEIKYVDMPVVEKPQLIVDVPVVTDFDGNRVTDANKVNPALSSIKLTFSSPIIAESAEDISLESSAGEKIKYKWEITDGVYYTMNFTEPKIKTETLLPNTKYVIKVPITVKGEDGAMLEKDWNYEFTTVDGKVKMEMTALSIKSVSDVTNGGKVYPRLKYANSTNSKADVLLIVGFYDENNTMLGSSCLSASVPAREMYVARENIGIDVPGADNLDLSKVSRVSVYLWDSVNNMMPYCEHIDVR